ncbi:right-handed parallel beta-helix repeat-containing protein [Thalassotalea fonticola]|uniref:Right-handed parallel beta-helix repeat-containing protein n=1 Tax=Thalassotalea fonticola TaxID=3065649 RepID=A0ABZ0GLJ5_9GAMM|nr:right-handed parallel beta-helix repeat-containing protein [Colwelliaceae bacterium S1-1]
MMRIITAMMIIIALISNVYAADYYVHPQGNDKNSGLSQFDAWQTLSKASQQHYQPGDNLLLAKGQQFYGELLLSGQHGQPDKPIRVSSYAQTGINDQSAYIDAGKEHTALSLINSSYIEVSDLALSAITPIVAHNNKVVKYKAKPAMRLGVLVKTTLPGEYPGIVLKRLQIKDVFYHQAGFQRGSDEVKTANGKQSYGWGIRVINNLKRASFIDLEISDSTISNVSHTGIKFTSKHQNIEDVRVINNDVLKTGGPGIQLSGVKNGYFAHNRVNYSGSNNDSRKWGRGSGLWTWGSDNILIEHNEFKNANGPGDSAGVHIDFNCSNVVVQYNFSANNAGGFCEILGNNFNNAYRYNISVNDGRRVKGVDGAFQQGKTFWLSGYRGKNKTRSGPFHSYFYNNTIYVDDTIISKIAIDNKAKGILIANNIFHIVGKSEAVLGDQYRADTANNQPIENVVFTNNLFLNQKNWPSDIAIKDSNPLFGNARFINAGGLNKSDYRPTAASLIKGKGIAIKALPGDNIGLEIGFKVNRDILNNPIRNKPDLGAIEIQ